MPQKKHFLAVCEYAGTNYFGFQVQPGRRTVEGEIRKVLALLADTAPGKILLSYSSRLDSGVHSKGLVLDFVLPSRWSCRKLRQIINFALPSDIRFCRVVPCPPDFNSRHSPIGKIYTYTIALEEKPSPFIAPYVWWTKKKPDISLMKRAAARFIGKEDYRNFISSGSGRKRTVSEIKSIRITTDGNLISIRFTGKRFYYRMVRNIAGFLYETGLGRFTPDEAGRIMRSAGKPPYLSAPACGLTLEKVILKPFRLMGS